MQEIDRFDVNLGSPLNATLLASATKFGSDMVRTKEEFDAAMVPSLSDPKVRADIVFFQTPNGGGVFSVGSISWFGSLARNDYQNDTSLITRNVLDRFRDRKPF